MLEKHRASERRILELQGRERTEVPRYGQQEDQQGSLLGRELAARAVLAYGDSLYLQPLQDTRLPARLEELEAERKSGSSVRSPARFPARLKARSQTVGQQSAVRPQFQSQPLVGERLSRYYSRTRPRQDRAQLRARVRQRNSLLASHLLRQQLRPDSQAGFSFNFRVQH